MKQLYCCLFPAKYSFFGSMSGGGGGALLSTVLLQLCGWCWFVLSQAGVWSQPSLSPISARGNFLEVGKT